MFSAGIDETQLLIEQEQTSLSLCLFGGHLYLNETGHCHSTFSLL